LYNFIITVQNRCAKDSSWRPFWSRSEVDQKVVQLSRNQKQY